MKTFHEPSAGTQDPLEALLSRVRPVIAQTVDTLQVAALLEVDGITDQLARSQYGFPDVFGLAAELRRRAIPLSVAPEARPSLNTRPRTLTRWRTAITAQTVAHAAQRQARLRKRDLHDLRLATHGLLYLLPAAVFPAILSVIGQEALVLGLALGGGIAWVWAGGATWLAYRLAGAQRHAEAAALLRASALCGLPVAAAAGMGVAVGFDGGWQLVAMACGQMAYQMGVTLIVYYQREVLLLVAMLPSAAVGVAYLLPSLAVPALWAISVGAIGVLSVLCIALAQTHRHGARGAAVGGGFARRSAGHFALAVLYTALTAAYLLHAQARYMLGSLEVAAGLLPLVAGMGIVELQAFRFRDRARSLMSSVRYPADFATGVRWMLATDILLCFVTVAGLGAALLTALYINGLLTPAGVMMTVSSMFLAGAYYVGFLLAGMARLVAPCVATAVSLVAHVLIARTLPTSQPLVDTAVFAGISLALLVMFVFALLPFAIQPRAHV